MSDFKVIHNDDALVILTAAWRMTKRHYEIILGTSAMVLLTWFAASKIPYVKYFNALPLIYLGVGQMYVLRRLIENQPTKFTDIFKPIEDRAWMNALLPLALSGVAIAFVDARVESAFDDGFFAELIAMMVGLTLSLIWLALTAFSGPLISFRQMTFGKSVDVNLRATAANWMPLLLLALYLLAVIVVSTICLVLPLFFVGLPVMLVAGYLTYLSIFEDVNIAELAERYRN